MSGLDHTVKFLTTTVGRDRVNRFVQYFSRYLAYALQDNKELSERFTKLGIVVGQTRKVMQTGRQLEFLASARKALSLKDTIVANTTVGKNAFLSLWLACDTMQWLHTAGFLKFENIKEISRRAMQFWLTALCISIVGNLHKLRVNAMRMELESKAIKLATARKENDDVASKSLVTLKSERGKLLLATLQDALDIILPSSVLEYVVVPPGIVGLIGSITSLLGGYSHWRSI